MVAVDFSCPQTLGAVQGRMIDAGDNGFAVVEGLGQIG